MNGALAEQRARQSGNARLQHWADVQRQHCPPTALHAVLRAGGQGVPDLQREAPAPAQGVIGMAEAQVPIRAVTRGPKFHWFSYYDKLQFDPSGRFLLGMETDFEHRLPAPGEAMIFAAT